MQQVIVNDYFLNEAPLLPEGSIPAVALYLLFLEDILTKFVDDAQKW